VLIDQTALPAELRELACRDAATVHEAIRTLRVRGAPAIGIAAAYGVCLGMQPFVQQDEAAFFQRLPEVTDFLAGSRPTAVNLFWALRRVRERAESLRGRQSPTEILAALLAEACAIHAEDRAMCHAIGRHGADLLPDGVGVLTHCNAGGLATAGYGTALGVIRGAIDAGKTVRVIADETRPFLQGARLTAWELLQDGIETLLIADGAAGSLMRRREIDLVVVGADRIAANGDVANKIGTYPVAVLAKENGIPFYVAAPTSTIDLACPDGEAIPIEERDPREVTELFGTRIAPAGVGVLNPAFDVTPQRYVAAIVTERGIARPPYAASLAALRR
jgi:methylthioribose-1-phosphate isomerase